MTLVKDEKNAEEETKEVETSFKVAVYGSLRKGLSNHTYLQFCRLLGIYETQPEYTMYSVSGHFPGLIENGNTSIVMEVYEVDEEELAAIDGLEGYRSPGNKYNYYDRKVIDTPYGEAFTYIYNNDPAGLYVVESGDWVSFKETANLANAAKC